MLRCLILFADVLQCKSLYKERKQSRGAARAEGGRSWAQQWRQTLADEAREGPRKKIWAAFSKEA